MYKTKICVTHLFPHLGIPTAWMMKITTWQKNTKKKKKKLKELSVLKKERERESMHFTKNIYFITNMFKGMFAILK